MENFRDDCKNKVYMVDLSIQPYNDLQLFKNWCDELGIEFYWIDHHMSAIESTKHFKIPGLQSIKHAGCWLVWSFLNCDSDLESLPPLIIQKVSDYDTWNKKSKFNWQEELLPLTYLLESYGSDLNDKSSLLLKLLSSSFIEDNSFITNMEANGKVIFTWITQQYKNHIRRMYEYDWNDYKCLVINSSFKGSSQFEVLPEEDLKQYDLLIAWSFNGEKFEYCMYSRNPKINCGSICKTYLNGGGHPGAAGGNSKKLIFANFKGNYKQLF